MYIFTKQMKHQQLKIMWCKKAAWSENQTLCHLSSCCSLFKRKIYCIRVCFTWMKKCLHSSAYMLGGLSLKFMSKWQRQLNKQWQKSDWEDHNVKHGGRWLDQQSSPDLDILFFYKHSVTFSKIAPYNLQQCSWEESFVLCCPKGCWGTQSCSIRTALPKITVALQFWCWTSMLDFAAFQCGIQNL